MKKNIVAVLFSVMIFAFVVYGAKKVAFIDQSKCIQCGTCFKNCPVKAIGKIEKDGKISYVVDPKKCIACGTCAKNCPKKAVSLYDENAVPVKTDTTKGTTKDTTKTKPAKQDSASVKSGKKG